MKFFKFIDTPIGTLEIGTTTKHLIRITSNLDTIDLEDKDQSLLMVENQLKEYFSGERKEFDFDLKCDPIGSNFQNLVWKEVKNIPYGETRTYGQIAKNIGKPTAARAVGMALNKNPVLIVVPCHRVIGANGNLTGFAAGIENKKWLLNFERNNLTKQTKLH